MNIKNLSQGFIFLLSGAVILLSSCLGSNDEIQEYSADAQIYSFSAKASQTSDSLNVLSSATFAIDQLSSQPKIYTRDSLAYQFEVKNALITINTKNANGIVLYYADKDSSFIYNSADSVNLARLTKLTVYANDGITTREYAFKINIHQQDPNVLNWKNIANNYVQASLVAEQKTISLNGKFLTYYISGGAPKAVSSPATDGKTWTTESLNGLPANIRLNSLLAVTINSAQTAYVVTADNLVYSTSDGISWNNANAGYPVEAIYENLPSVSADSLIIAVKDGSTLKFAKTKDFSSIRTIGEIPVGFPVEKFSAVPLQNPESYTMKYIIVAGGIDVNGTANNKTWLIQEKDGALNAISRTAGSLLLEGCSLFNYDNKLYILTTGSENKNRLSHSNYGQTWDAVSAKQALPDGFPNRKHASVICDDKNYIWIFGGASGSTQIVDVWRGRINRLAVN